MERAKRRRRTLIKWRNRAIGVVILAVLALAASQCGQGTGGASDPPKMRPTSVSLPGVPTPGVPTPIAPVLDRIPVGALDTAAGDRYRNNRTALFGRAWIDVDRNGCATDDDIARRDLVGWTPDGRCDITGGVLAVTYSGGIDGQPPDPLANRPRVKQLDHVNALGHAYESGAANWSQDMRIAFANDPRNLIYTDRHGNESKGDSGPDDYLPPNPRAVCRYVHAFITVTAAYPLTITPTELSALREAVLRCPAPETIPETER